MNTMQSDSHHFDHPFQEDMLGKLWEPVSIGSLALKNRIAMAPIQVLPAENVWPDMHETHVAFHEAIARGGAGLIVIGESDVTPDSKGTVQRGAGAKPRPTKGIWSDDAIPGWNKLIDACHKWGAKVIPQLSSYADWRPQTRAVRSEGAVALIVPSWEEIGMTPDRLEEELENFVAAALRAKEAGADGVEIAGTRESLVASLVSPVRNPGVPGYSEGFNERVRFPVECIKKIKSACGEDFPVLIRLTSVEYFTGGYDTDYAKQVAKAYADAGIDAIDVVQAGFSTQLPQLQMVAPPGLFVHNARAVKAYFSSLGSPYDKVKIMNACRIQSPWLAASSLRNGDFDIASLCRQLMIDPEWPNKIREKRVEEIIPCIGCAWCMRSPTCAVNPQSPFYKSPKLSNSLNITKTPEPKKVLVAGGGMAGMEAARVAALRGHSVVLYEKERELGRKLFIQSLPPFRSDMDLLRKYLSREVKNKGVDIKLGEYVTPEIIKKENLDVVIVATGCRPAIPEIPGIDIHQNVVFAEDALLGKADIGESVVVIDADQGKDYCSLGSFTADYLARSTCTGDDIAMHIMRWSPQHTPDQIKKMVDSPEGRKVTLVTKQKRVADVEYHHYTTVEDLRRLGVTVITGCEYKTVDEKGLIIVRDGKEERLPADTIVTANYEPDDALYKQLEGTIENLHLIGDARAVKVQFIGNIHTANRLALSI